MTELLRPTYVNLLLAHPVFSQLQLNTFIEPEDGVDAKNLPRILTSCFICPSLFQLDIIQLSVFQSQDL